jgi:hypothetical protein
MGQNFGSFGVFPLRSGHLYPNERLHRIFLQLDVAAGLLGTLTDRFQPAGRARKSQVDT